MTAGVSSTTLHAMLAAAARSPDWVNDVVHRCAWCSRVADADNIYRPARMALTPRAATDGMCPDCWVAATHRLAARRGRQLVTSRSSAA